MPDLRLRIDVVHDPEERTRAVASIERTMRDRFKCDPPKTTGLILIARKQGRVVGSVAIEGATEGKPFSIERHYTFDTAGSPFSSIREFMVEGTRWNALEKDVSLPLALASMRVATSLGKRHMLIEAKPRIVTHLSSLSIRFSRIEDASLLPEVVQEEVGAGGMRYFLEEPFPSLYLCDMLETLRMHS